MKQAIIFVFILLSAWNTVSAQSLQELQDQRKKTEASIALTNKMLAKNSKSKNQELSNLKLLSKKIAYRERLITDIDNETVKLKSVIKEKELAINSYTTDLDTMKANYADLIQHIWTRRSSYGQIMYVLAGEDVGQIYRRFRYLNEFSAYQKSQAAAIQDLAQRLILERDSLAVQKHEQTALLTKYNSETKKLETEKSSKKQKVDSLKQKESELKKELFAQQKKRDKLKRFVANLLAEEAKKANKGSDGKMKMTPEQELTSSQFTGNKGKLPWPVSSGIVDEPYGKHQHELFNGVQVENDGVDIRTDKGNNARSVFDGEVTSVVALPSHNKGIIVRHGEYSTLYANLSEVYVKKGDFVSTKQKLGKIYTDKDEKSILHFQVWKGMTKQNPQLWISK